MNHLSQIKQSTFNRIELEKYNAKKKTNRPEVQLKQCVILKSKLDSYRLQGSCIKDRMNKKANVLSANQCCVSSGDSNSHTSCRGCRGCIETGRGCIETGRGGIETGRGGMECGRGGMESGGV